jgi:class 3 adenylate cyclase
MGTPAIVIFVDIRGFTRWSEGIEAFQYIDIFISDFYNIITESFSSSRFTKHLGDGAMIIEKIEGEFSGNQLTNVLKTELDKIECVEKEFQKLCNDFSESRGYRTELRLGWGLVRGVIKPLINNGDYIGANINKCARLCGIARPFGIVIEMDDFPNLPKDTQYNFVKQVRKLEGIIDDVDVWVTTEISNQLVPREKIRESPEVHVAGLCIKTEGNEIKALIAKRNPNRRLFPSLYEGCGGQLKYSESFEDGVKRHYSREMHIDVQLVEHIYSFYEIKVPNEPLIPGIRFLCKYIGGSPESKNHSEIRWISEDELKAIPSSEFIPGLKEEFIKFIARFTESRH